MEMGHGLEGREGGRKGGREGCESIPPHWRNRLCVYEWVYVCVCVSMYWGGGCFRSESQYSKLPSADKKKWERPHVWPKKKAKKKKQQDCQEEVTHWLLSMRILQAGRYSRLPPLYICRRGAGQHTTWREDEKLKCQVLLGGLPLKPGTCTRTITHALLYSPSMWGVSLLLYQPNKGKIVPIPTF